jgi:pimeloyl-ACP methyl ester carboxylesterase
MSTFVLIPGAGGDAGYWHLLAAELQARGHEAIPVDLPAADDAAGIPEYVDAVVAAIGDRQHVVLVAQSMGGFTAPHVAARASVAMIVLLNAMIPAPGETAGDWWSNTNQAQAKRDNDIRDGRDPDAPFDLATLFFHDVPQDIAGQAMAHEQPQSDTAFASPSTLDRWPDVPTRVLSSTDDRLFPIAFQRRVAQERLGITPDEIPGGHLPALSRPRELSDRLEQYAREAATP